MHTFISDISGVKRATLVLRANGRERRLVMNDCGPYPTQTGAALTAGYYTAALPVGVGDLRYFVEAEDGRGAVARSALERVYLA